MVSTLHHHLYIDNFYSAEEIINVLNVEADVNGNGAINTGIDVTLLLQAIAADCDENGL